MAYQEEMEKVTSAGFHTVLSAPFYLNYISYGALRCSHQFQWTFKPHGFLVCCR